MGLTAHPAAVHHQNVAVNIVARRGAEKDSRAGQIAGLAPPADGDALENLAAALRVVAQRRRIVRGHIARRDGVDVDALGCPLVRERLGELRHASFGRGVSGHQNSALKREQRGNVQNLAFRAPLQHVLPGELRKPEHSSEVYGDHFVPVLLRKLGRRRPANRARIVDRSEEHTSELQSLAYLVCRLLLEKKKKKRNEALCYT